MIARKWHGVTPASKSEAYHQYMLKVGVSDLRATPGNRGVYMWRRIEGDRAHFEIISLWDSYDDIRRFAGRDVEKAVYYPEDKDFLLELGPHVTHYEVLVHP
ncbi:MAG: antibiotic biosynthesis monooxygenase [Candidatus Acidiferrales bacterium]